MIKNISILEIEKEGKSFPKLYLDKPITWGELFDYSMELRQMALNGIQEVIKNEPVKMPEAAPEAEQPKEG